MATPIFDIVIFGGMGDLSMRKLLPALYQCEKNGGIADESRIILTGRQFDITTEILRDKIKSALQQHTSGEWDEATWKKLKPRLHMSHIDLKATDKPWDNLASQLDEHPDRIRIYYLALSSQLYGATCLALQVNNLITSESRLVVEKPIGHDLETAHQINNEIGQYFTEKQIYRIDHYLGKETVQNLMAIRFNNPLLGDSWDNKMIDQVEITISETVGLEGRVGFYDHTGAIRDMIQNHLIQLLCLVTMEPPYSLDADSIRSEKLKVLKALRPIAGDNVEQNVIRGQYTSGQVNNQSVPGYRDELGKESNTETFVAMRAHIDNWRWAGVPFYLRTGKRMKERYAEVIIRFKPLRHQLYPSTAGNIQPNKLILRLQPEETVQLQLMTKKVGKNKLEPVTLDLNLAADSIDIIPAYGRLLLDIAAGDQGLFAHKDEVELSWTWIDSIINQQKSIEPLPYFAGSNGPSAANDLIKNTGHTWGN